MTKQINLTAVFLMVTVFLLLSCMAFSQSWSQKASFPGVGRIHGTGFSIGSKGYIGIGMTTGLTLLKDFWEWDQAANVWTQKADFGPGAAYGAASFSIGSKGYVATDNKVGAQKQDLWEYDQATNIWTKKTPYPGLANHYSIGFSIGAKGYVGTGGYPHTADFWEWDQATDTWTQRAGFLGTPREAGVGFSIGTKGYMGTGYDGTGMNNDFWEWDQATDTWSQKASCPGIARWFAVGFSIGNKGYLGTGGAMGAIALKDFWQWDQATNTWTQQPDYSGGPTFAGVGFSIGNYGYIGTGRDEVGKAGSYIKDYWEFCPTCPPPCVLSANIASSAATLCIGSSATISASGGTGYAWNTGAATPSIVVSPSVNTSYTVIVSDASGCKDTVSINVPVKNCCSVTPAINSDPSPNTTFCVGQNVYLAASGGTSYVWSTGETYANIASTLSVTTTFSVTVTDAGGCTGTASTTFIVDPNCTTTGISQFNSGSIQSGIWPNPSNGIFTLDMAHNLTADAGIEIFNVFGERIYQSAVSGQPQSIDISSRPKGIYMLKLTWGKETAFAKIIIRQ